MADSNTETATTPSESGVQKGSEFSKPQGAKDDEVWAKHFGKEAKGSSKEPTKKAERSTKPKSDEPARSRDSSSESKKPAASTTTDKSSSPKDTKSTKAESSESSKGKDKTPGKSEPKSSKDAASEATGQKTADKADAETDPEAPSKKARDLFEQAKKTEDRREARKLYKRAMTEAFGEVPEEFDDHKYAAVRTERAAAKAALDEQGKKNEGRINEAVEKLKPAIYVMRQLEGSGLADKLTVPMVERAVSVLKALRSLEDGDFTQLAEVVSRAAGVDHDEAMKRFVRGVKVSPEGRAARQAAEQAQRDNQTLRQEMDQLRKQLTERDTAQTEAQKTAAHEQAVAEHRARYIEDIESELDGHAVMKLPRGAERVLAYLIRTANPQTKSPRYSFEEAANRIVAAEKKRLQGARHLLDDGDERSPAEPQRSVRSVPRGETADVGLHKESPEASFDRIFHKVMGGGRR